MGKTVLDHKQMVHVELVIGFCKYHRFNKNKFVYLSYQHVINSDSKTRKISIFSLIDMKTIQRC